MEKYRVVAALTVAIAVSGTLAAADEATAGIDVLRGPAFGLEATLEMRDVPLGTVFATVRKVTGVDFKVEPSLATREVTVALRHMPWWAILDAVAADEGLAFEKRGAAVLVRDARQQ